MERERRCHNLVSLFPGEGHHVSSVEGGLEMTRNLLSSVLALALCGCSARVETVSQTAATNVVPAVTFTKLRNDKSPFSESLQEPQDFMNVMHIVLCTNSGLYELKTDIQLLGEFESLQAAREYKTNKAAECSAYWKSHPLLASPIIPDCGKRIE
jgi:hypothetical protein